MSRYVSFTQKPCCCSAACVKLVLKRRGFEVDELEIAKALGTRVTSTDVRECNDLPVNDENPGLNLEEFESKPAQDFLAKYGVRVKVYPLSNLSNLNDFIEKNLTSNNDVIVNIHHKPFSNGKNGGHYVLIDEVNTGKVTFCDPALDTPKFWETSIEKLKEAISDKCDGKERGLVVFSSCQV